MTLRRFRDRRLYPSRWGRAAIAIYYLCSPHLARWIMRGARRHGMARALLDRVVRRLGRPGE
jgi:hypothetical protein